MNEQKTIENMIGFIEQKERELQANKLIKDQDIKSDVVKAILDELERETANEN